MKKPEDRSQKPEDRNRNAVEKPARPTEVEDRMMRPKGQKPEARSQKPEDLTFRHGLGLWWLLLLAPFFCLLTPRAQGATVTGLLSTASSNPYATNVLFTPVSTPLISGGLLIGSAPSNVLASSAGVFSVVLKAGNYRVNIGELKRDTFIISVPTNSATYNITDLITNALTYSHLFSPIYQLRTEKAQTNGYASLGSDGLVPSAQLPAGISGNFQSGSMLLSNFLRMGISNIVAGSGIAIGTNNGTLWITNTAGGGGGGVRTNENQFGAAGAVLTIADGALLTNTHVRNLFADTWLEVNGMQTNRGGVYSPAVYSWELANITGIQFGDFPVTGTASILNNGSEYYTFTPLSFRSQGASNLFDGAVHVSGPLRAENVIASRVAVINAQKVITNSAAVDLTELDFLDGVSSAIQTQFTSATNNTTTASNNLRAILIANDTTTSNGAVAFTMTASNALRGDVVARNQGEATNLTVQGLTVNTNLLLQTATASRVAIFDSIKQLTNSAAVDTTELEYLDGVSSAIQTQFNAATNRTETKQNGSAALTNASANPNLVTNILGAGIVTVTSNNLGTFTISASSAAGPAIVTNTIWVSAGAMAPGGGTTSDGGRNGGAAGSITNAAFSTDVWMLDDTTNECVVFTFQPGYGFAGDVVASLYWTSTNTLNGASNVVWDAGVSLLNSNSVFSFNVYQTNGTFRFWSSNSVQIAKLPRITIASGVSPDTLLTFRLSRLGTNASDAALGDAYLFGARISFTTTNWLGGFP